jgi:hypothetical protein
LERSMIGEKLYWSPGPGDGGAGIPTGASDPN